MPPMTRGTMHACACPHCRKPNDFSDDGEVLEKGNSFNCDHCKRVFFVVEARRVTLVTLSATAPR